MELTFESAFSVGGIVGHASYLLLVVSMMMRTLWMLRVLVIASSVAGITFDAVWLNNPVGVFWESLLVAVNLVQLGIIHLENRRARFTPEEARFMETRFPDLGRAQRRRLLNHGLWITGEPGVELTREGQPVRHLVFLASCEARIDSGGQTVASCEPGAFVGEMTVLGGESATGTAVLTRPGRYWCIEAGVLRTLVRRYPEIRSALEAAFAINLREKLIRSNRRAAEQSAAPAGPPPGR